MQVVRPLLVGLRPDEPHAPHAGLHARVELLQDLRIDLELDAEHQFRPLVFGFDGLGRELRVGRDEADFRRNDIVGNGVEDDPRLVADRQPAGVRRRKEKRHIDVGQIEDRHDRRARRNHLAGACELVLHSANPRRDESEVADDRLDALDLRFRILDLGLGLIPLRREALHRRDRRVVVAFALLEHLLGDEPALHQFLAALEVGFGELERALARGDLRLGGDQGVFGVLHVGLRRPQLRLVFRRGNARDHLPLRDARALLDRHFREPTGIFRRHVDLGRFDPSIRLDDARRQRFTAQTSNQIADNLRVSCRHEGAF